MIKKIFQLMILTTMTASLLWNIPPAAAALQTSTSYYVSPSGNDSNAGTVSSPLKTMAKAFNLLKAGDILYIRGGTYTAPATGWQFANSGTASQPITVTNYPGERVVLTTDNSVSGNYIIKCLQISPAVNYIRIMGTNVAPQVFDGVTTSNGIIMTGVRTGIAPAITAYQCDNWEVAGVDFIKVAYGIFQRKVSNGGTSADKWYVHDNRVYEYYRESGMQFNGNGNRIENNEIIKLTADYNSTYGCQLLNLLGNNNVVRGNKLTRIDQTIRCIGIFFEWDLADNNLVENNIITGVSNGISFFGGDKNVIRNNQLTGVDTAFVVRSWADGTTAYPCNFSDFMPLESDVASPDWGYMYPHDCRSKDNRFENNSVSGFKTFSAVNLPEASNVFVNASGPTATPVPGNPTATNTASAPTNNPPPVTAQTRMLIPLYTHPSNWGQVISANVGNVIDVIINPRNGVGSAIQTSFVNGIASLRGAGIGIFGYVPTGYGTRDISAIKSEVDTWQAWYAPSGIFLDEVDNTNDANKLAYYNEIYNYIRSKGLSVIINPGAMTTESYMSRSDVACIFESSPPNPIPYPTWAQPAKLCALSFNTSRDQMISFVAETKGRFRYIYATSDTLGNPWDNLPDYLAEQASLIAGLPVPTNTVPATPTSIPAITFTSTPVPAVTTTATPTEIIATATGITLTPLPQTPIIPTFTVTPPTLPSGTSVLTSVDPKTLLVSQTGLVSVSLNGLPPEGISSVEFTCTYAADQISVGNVQIGEIFGGDPVSAYNNSQTGSFIYAVAASNGKVINTNGVAFTFNVTGIQPGSSSLECKAKISRANSSLENIASLPDSITVSLVSAPTATPLSAPMLTGQVIAMKPVEISLFNPDATLVATAMTNPDGSFNLIAPAGSFTIVASADGYLSAQASVTLLEGTTTTLDPIILPAGDIDNNNVIDQYDALTVGMNYNTSASLPADLSNDGLINVIDLEMLAENYRMAGLFAWQQP